MFNNVKIKQTAILALVLALPACSSTRISFPRQGAQIAKTWLFQNAVIDLQASYISEDYIYLRYATHLNETSNIQFFFAKAPVTALAPQDKGIYIPSRLEFVDEKSWKLSVKDARQIDTLTQEDWKNFRSRLAHQLAPQQKNTATLFQKGETSFVVFYDENDSVTIVDKQEKPDHVIITQTIDAQELAGVIVEVLDKYTDDLKKRHKQFVMATGSSDSNEQPFLFADVENNVVIGLSLVEPKDKAYEENSFKKNLKTLDYLLWDSHVIGLLRRPISSGFRLFAWSKDAAYDLVNPQSITLLEQQPLPPLSDSEGMDLAEWEKELDRILGHPAQRGTIKFLIGGEAYFPRLIDVLKGAQKSIEIRTFIFDNDDYGVEIANILKKKSHEKGIKVKVLLDAMGQIMGEGKVPADLPVGFKPPGAIADYLQEGSSVQVRLRPNAWFKADHTKTLTIDNQIMFTGGMNIGREYRYNWHDLMMEVQGPIIDEISREFRLAWEHAGSLGDVGYMKALLQAKDYKVPDEGYPIHTLYTRLNDPQIYRAQIAAIRRAKKYIYIHNAYFADTSILYELIRARRRGVDVRVVLPINGNHEIMNAGNVVNANIMFRNGIRVFFYPGMSHVKAAIFDGWLCSGSANFDRLSLRDNLELNLGTSEPRLVNALLKDLFEADFAKSHEMQKPITQGLKEMLGAMISKQL